MHRYDGRIIRLGLNEHPCKRDDGVVIKADTLVQTERVLDKVAKVGIVVGTIERAKRTGSRRWSDAPPRNLKKSLDKCEEIGMMVRTMFVGSLENRYKEELALSSEG